MATWFKARANQNSDSPNYIGIGLRRCIAGMAIEKSCYYTLFADAQNAILALEKGVITEALENVIEANILLSGLGFQNTGFLLPMEYPQITVNFFSTGSISARYSVIVFNK